MPDPPLLGSQTPLGLLLSSGPLQLVRKADTSQGKQELQGLRTSEEATLGEGSDKASEKGQHLSLAMEDEQDGDL